MIAEWSNGADAYSPRLEFMRSRGTAGVFTAVADNDIIGHIKFAAADGTDATSEVAAITVEIDGTAGANDVPGRMIFSTTADGAAAPTERMRLDASGNLGLGVSPSFVLDILDAGTAGYTMQLHNNGGVAGNFGIQMLCGADDGSGQTIYINALDGDGSQNGYIEHSAGGTFQLVNVSDERLKEDIEPTTIKGIAGIRKIEVIDFTRPKSGVRVEGGFSAQQLQTIYPQAVSEMEDGFLGVADTALVAPLVKSVQELDGTMQTFMGRDLERKTELETLREKVEAQGKEIVELQEQLKRAA